MSTNRKMRRAQKANEREPAKPGSPPRKDKEQLRRQLSSQRFATPGSERLWPVLLGWDAERTARGWVLDTLHDATRRSELQPVDPGLLLAELERRVPGAAARLDADDVQRVVSSWLESEGEGESRASACQWSLLSDVCVKLGLGRVLPAALREDWELWTNLGVSGQPRQALLAALAQTEQAALALFQTTKSDNVQAIATLARLSWVALAYGDAGAFARLRAQGSQWLEGDASGASSGPARSGNGR
jgi:hypothetical protein